MTAGGCRVSGSSSEATGSGTHAILTGPEGLFADPDRKVWRHRRRNQRREERERVAVLVQLRRDDRGVPTETAAAECRRRSGAASCRDLQGACAVEG